MRGRWRGDDAAATRRRRRGDDGAGTTARRRRGHRRRLRPGVGDYDVGVDDAGTAARRRRRGDDEAGTRRDTTMRDSLRSSLRSSFDPHSDPHPAFRRTTPAILHYISILTPILLTPTLTPIAGWASISGKSRLNRNRTATLLAASAAEVAGLGPRNSLACMVTPQGKLPPMP